jgi:DNA-binding transcriptional ArsR family regulator
VTRLHPHRIRVGAPTRDAVLAALVGGAEVTVPELATRLGTTPGALASALATLAKGKAVTVAWRDTGPGKQVQVVRAVRT